MENHNIIITCKSKQDADKLTEMLTLILEDGYTATSTGVELWPIFGDPNTTYESTEDITTNTIILE